MGGAGRGLIGGASEGGGGTRGGVLLLGELVALSILVARELLVLSEGNQYIGLAHLEGYIEERGADLPLAVGNPSCCAQARVQRVDGWESQLLRQGTPALAARVPTCSRSAAFCC